MSDAETRSQMPDHLEIAQVLEIMRRTAEALNERQNVDLRPTKSVGDSSVWLTRKESSEYAKVSMDTIDDWCAKGYIVKSKLGGGRAGTVLISRESIDKFIRSRIVNRPNRVRKDYAPSVKGGYRV